MKRILLLLASAILLFGCTAAPRPIPVIFDTDMGNDIDDALALQMLFNYERQGLIELKGITISKCNPHSVEFVDGVCRFNGFENMPLGFSYNGPNPEDNTYLLPTLEAKKGDGSPLIEPQRTLDSGIDEGHIALRKMLVKEKDGSVLLIATGPLTNIARLLESAPDEISPLDGVALVQKKVKSLHIMNGFYDRVAAEWNTLQDLEASKIVFDLCPVQLIASGWEIGGVVHYPHESILGDFGNPDENPVCVAYVHYQPMPYDRETWDLTSVFDAIDPDHSVFQRSEPGRIAVREDGATIFTPDPAGKHQYLIVPNPDKAVKALVNRVTGADYTGQGLSLFSPDCRNRFDASYENGKLCFKLLRDRREILSSAPASMQCGSWNWAAGNPLVTVRRGSFEETVDFPVQRKYASVDNIYNSLFLDFGGYEVEMRAYDSGVAYRFVGKTPGVDKVCEKGGWRFPEDSESYTLLVDKQQNWFEENYTEAALSALPKDKFSMIPVLVKSRGVNVLLTEADTRGYAQPYLRPTGDGFDAEYPLYPSKEEMIEWNNKRYAVERFPYIVETSLERSFPWKVAATFDSDAEILADELVYLLSEKSSEDWSWIKPGKVLWDWWNDRNITGVPFTSGINTDTYMYLVDYAAKHHFEYVLLDEGWSNHDDIFTLNPETDIPAVCKYAERKGVGIILWAKWVDLDGQIDEVLDMMAAWNVKGVKIDFMDRNDAEMVDFYENIAVAAAERHMLVDFHGAYPNEGMRALYPNLMTREGVVGLEYNKMRANMDTPHHELLIPFIRQWVGPMDFTLGAILNAQPEQHVVNHHEPMSQGTRCHQMAMFVVYESPLQMVSDSPSKYDTAPEWFPFLEAVPSVWDETVPLAGEIGNYVAVARRSGKTWYLGVMGAGEPRDLEIPLCFLGGKTHKAVLYKDGPDADEQASSAEITRGKYGPEDTLCVHLARNGGFIATFEK